MKEPKLDHETVALLEENIERAIADVFTKMGKKNLPLLPDDHALHLMAKAAVTVYESIVHASRR